MSTATAARRAPVDLPAPYSDHPIAREPMWIRYAFGADLPPVPPWTDEPPFSSHVAPGPPVTGTPAGLPRGTFEILGRTAFPAGRVSDVDDPFRRALVAAFGVQWQDADNAYPAPHRGYASARCLYPVQVFVEDAGHWWWLDPERHALVALPVPSAGGRRVVLAGRYSRIPRAYKWFRGSIVNLELGIALRTLGTGLELFGLSGQVRLPDAAGERLLAGLGLTPVSDWSLPIVIDVDPAGDLPSDAPVALPVDAVLEDVLRLNHGQSVPSTGPLAAIPAAGGAGDWAGLMWRRNSGLMPRGLHGMSGRRARVSGQVVQDAVRWLTPPPTPLLADVADTMTVTAVIQDVEGHRDGAHRVHSGRMEWTAAVSPTDLEAEYDYPLAPDSGCDIRHATAVWFCSVRPRELVARYGPAGWSAAQYVAGWHAHGLSLAAASAGLFARPVRAFKEIPVQRLLGLPPDEMLVLATVTGTPRAPGGALLDVRL